MFGFFTKFGKHPSSYVPIQKYKVYSINPSLSNACSPPSGWVCSSYNDVKSFLNNGLIEELITDNVEILQFIEETIEDKRKLPKIYIYNSVSYEQKLQLQSLIRKINRKWLSKK